MPVYMHDGVYMYEYNGSFPFYAFNAIHLSSFFHKFSPHLFVPLLLI